MRDFRSAIMSVFLALATWTATVNPLQADTGTVRVLFGTAGIVVGVGNGRGTLTFHGKTYPFEVSGASFGASLAQTVSDLEGRALNLRAPGALAGNYIAVGADRVRGQRTNNVVGFPDRRASCVARFVGVRQPQVHRRARCLDIL